VLSQLTSERSDMISLMIVVAGVVLVFGFAAGLFLRMRKKTIFGARRAKLYGKRPKITSSSTATSSSDIQLQNASATESSRKPAKTFKSIPFADITFGDELGNGAFGIVYKCTFQATKCAIKKLHDRDERSQKLVSALVEEFDVMSALRHPNVLLTLGIAEDAYSGSKGILMELMEASLMDVLNLPSFQQFASWEGAFFSIAADVASGMAYIHFNNMLHRDLKPGNILLDAQWVAKIADFGTVFDPSNNGKTEGDIQGTPPYMAPEIVQAKEYTKPVDAWAFGCILAHMGSKRPPYAWLTHIESPKQLINVIKHGEHSPLELLLESDTPESMKQLAKACCHPMAGSRPDFETISQKIDVAVPDGVDPRPVARIKNKHPLKTAMAEGISKPERQAGSTDKSYRDKFRNYQKEKKSTPAELAGTSAEASGEVERPSLFSTFSDTLLTTFTPGKGPQPSKD